MDLTLPFDFCNFTFAAASGHTSIPMQFKYFNIIAPVKTKAVVCGALGKQTSTVKNTIKENLYLKSRRAFFAI